MHTCVHALIRCMDFRLQKAIDAWMAENNLAGDCDMISVAGAGKDLVVNPDGFVATQVGLSSKLHNISTVLLMHHTDCGAYGGHGAFSSAEDERAHHIAEMAKAEATLKTQHPNLRVRKLLAVLVEESSFVIEEVG